MAGTVSFSFVSEQVRTATDLSTNGLIGVRVEANLPRLSCNVHSSAYLLLTRLLKNGVFCVEVFFAVWVIAVVRLPARWHHWKLCAFFSGGG